MVKSWKEYIHTLLVFAGLFSAVLTAFLIESYQWLLEDPADTTVALLTQISMQLNTSQAPYIGTFWAFVFEKWGVSPFLSVLPILLEVALLFFFVGILDLLAGLYFVTTFLPVLALFLRRKSIIIGRYGREFTSSYQFTGPHSTFE
ncbi:hypothetical protein MPER_10048 [Moniliophthora perniciosa FA553]|nr:hypothetical protein MPER_10048 [Moniliophthora perniciosa FA553]